MYQLILSLFFIVGVLSVNAAKKDRGPRWNDHLEVSAQEAICFALYTVHENTLKMTAVFYPLDQFEGYQTDTHSTLEIRRAGGDWQPVASHDVIEAGWTSHYRIENWDDTLPADYRVRLGPASYEGLITANPIHKEEVMVANLTCHGHFKAKDQPIDARGSWRGDVVENLKRLQPDILFFSGDQHYNHGSHYNGWIAFGRDYGDAIRNVPTITIPDDHDVGHGNLWGAGGKLAESKGFTDGGYGKSAEYVNEVHRAQVSHLPDPYDPTPIQRGISVYYTDYLWGGISFAILGDRQWKSGPESVLAAPIGGGNRFDHVTSPDYDVDDLDPAGVVLLGERQLDFLRDWTDDWSGAQFKALLSQTPFSGVPTRHGGGERLYCDLDSNGWPRSGRDQALREIRKSYAVHLNGDQHIAHAGQYGIDAFGDAGYMFCAPALYNSIYKRAILLEDFSSPGTLPANIVDGFGNKFTLTSYANPAPHTPENKMADGISTVCFNKKTGTIRYNVYPRHQLIGEGNDLWPGGAQPFGSFPLSVHLYDNFAQSSAWQLAPIVVDNADNAVIEIRQSSDDSLVSTVRILGNSFTPKVLAAGDYYALLRKDGKVARVDHLVASDVELKAIHVSLK